MRGFVAQQGTGVLLLPVPAPVIVCAMRRIEVFVIINSDDPSQLPGEEYLFHFIGFISVSGVEADSDFFPGPIFCIHNTLALFSVNSQWFFTNDIAAEFQGTDYVFFMETVCSGYDHSVGLCFPYHEVEILASYSLALMPSNSELPAVLVDITQGNHFNIVPEFSITVCPR
jgi:hypothetical protein